jgi:putative addiction module component (TIGR02574 family)
MSQSKKIYVEQMLNLPASERVEIVEQLLISLDRPDPEIDALWSNEVERRLSAFENGSITSKTIDQVYSKYKQ